MNAFEKRLSAALRKEIVTDHACIARTVSEVQNAYAAHPAHARLRFRQFVLLQARFFGARIWLWQAAVLAVLLGVLHKTCQADVRLLAYKLPFVLGCCGILTITAVIPLLYRTFRYRMAEMEDPCYFSGAQQLLARLIFAGLGILCIFAAIVAFAAAKTTFGVGYAAFHLMFSALLTACGYLILLAHADLQRIPMFGVLLSGGLVILLHVLLHYGWYVREPGLGTAAVCVSLLCVCSVQLSGLLHTNLRVVS